MESAKKKLKIKWASAICAQIIWVSRIFPEFSGKSGCPELLIAEKLGLHHESGAVWSAGFQQAADSYFASNAIINAEQTLYAKSWLFLLLF